MNAFYDDSSFNYLNYWLTRKYEDKAERIALKRLFNLISQKKTIVDIGCGFGRLTSEYAPLFKTCILIDPSEKLLKQAKNFCRKYKNLIFKKGTIEKISLKDKSVETILIIRTLHHLKNLNLAFREISRILKPEGWLILEFANKIRFKNILLSLFKFDFEFLTNHLPINIGKKKRAIPFFSYHPNQIITLLLHYNFKIIKIIPVSNFRHPLIKKLIPLPILLKLESFISLFFSHFPYLRFFGPSVFILAQKKG